MSESDDATRLAIEIRMQMREATIPAYASTAQELREKVGRYAEALKALGMTCQQAAAAMKAVVREARLEARPADDLLGDVDGWFAEAYESAGGTKTL
jgi:Holliday junction resolvasome RuvABC DNA-binding subunit